MSEVRFMISEAAKQVSVEAHVLRYWEEELELVVGRTEMGHRYYTKEDIQLFCCIKKLKNAGINLKDLKPLIPELKSTKLKLQKAEAEAKSEVPKLPEKTREETLQDTQLEQVRIFIFDAIKDALANNNQILQADLSKNISSNVIREMDFLLQAKERQEEERFRKLDMLIRQQQSNRKESVREHPIVRLKKILT